MKYTVHPLYSKFLYSEQLAIIKKSSGTDFNKMTLSTLNYKF
jgi:hypothetical protein